MDKLFNNLVLFFGEARAKKLLKASSSCEELSINALDFYKTTLDRFSIPEKSRQLLIDRFSKEVEGYCNE